MSVPFIPDTGNDHQFSKGALDSFELTDAQFLLCSEAQRFPVILRNAGQKITAAALSRKGWGTVEDGASGERIFRLNQAGCDAMEWHDDADHAAPCTVKPAPRLNTTPPRFCAW